MNILFLGHAGLFIETAYGSILCDPWFSPAFFASWFPFPDNTTIDREKIASPTYLYISHLHQDHFDARFLREYVSKEAIVLLPDYPLPLLERALRICGFTRFLRTTNGQMMELGGGLRLMIVAMVAPVDGPLGDSGILIDDGQCRIFNQNDSRPLDLDLLRHYGPYDAHFVQFSGAIWYPMVYQYPEKMVQALGRKKRRNEMDRALHYIQALGARVVIPAAGPPCFLDESLFNLNDFTGDPSNTFPDQAMFLAFLAEHGVNGQLMIPGSELAITSVSVAIEHPLPDEEIQAIFAQKRAYLERYQRRKQPLIDAEKQSWPRGQVQILPALQAWFEPLMRVADFISVGIHGRVVLDCQSDQILLDFYTRKVTAWQGEEWDTRFQVDSALIESCILAHEEDWVNQIFLSMRFHAQRKGVYNEYVYTFLKCLSPERLAYAETYYAKKTLTQQTYETNGYRIQRFCPHLNADLTRFGHIENNVLTCTLHGWQFDLTTGRCLTVEADQYHLSCQPIMQEEPDNQPEDQRLTQGMQPEPMVGRSVACHHCWYRPTAPSVHRD